MRPALLLLLLILLSACNKSKSVHNDDLNAQAINDSSASIIVSESAIDSLANLDYTSYWIVIADTSLLYDPLLKKMGELSLKLNSPIDSMGRFYNRKKDLVALPDTDDDELYAGEYFPRRYESDYLSIEYLNWYNELSNEKMLVIMAGIFVNESTADTALNKLKLINTQALKFKSKLYTGCMH